MYEMSRAPAVELTGSCLLLCEAAPAVELTGSCLLLCEAAPAVELTGSCLLLCDDHADCNDRLSMYSFTSD